MVYFKKSSILIAIFCLQANATLQKFECYSDYFQKSLNVQIASHPDDKNFTNLVYTGKLEPGQKYGNNALSLSDGYKHHAGLIIDEDDVFAKNCKKAEFPTLIEGESTTDQPANYTFLNSYACDKKLDIPGKHIIQLVKRKLENSKTYIIAYIHNQYKKMNDTLYFVIPGFSEVDTRGLNINRTAVDRVNSDKTIGTLYGNDYKPYFSDCYEIKLKYLN